MRIGVLAVQGAFIEHEKIIYSIKEKYNKDITCIEIRQKNDLNNIDGIILPGGESTVQSKLLKDLDIFNTLKLLIENGLPTLATCAGLILLANKLENDNTIHLGTMPISVKRNAYGRQLGSFTISGNIGSIKDYPLVFIRAPYITEVNNEVRILTIVNNRIVGVEYKNQLGFAFHPEMTNDTRIHEYFIEKIEKYISNKD